MNLLGQKPRVESMSENWQGGVFFGWRKLELLNSEFRWEKWGIEELKVAINKVAGKLKWRVKLHSKFRMKKKDWPEQIGWGSRWVVLGEAEAKRSLSASLRLLNVECGGYGLKFLREFLKLGDFIGKLLYFPSDFCLDFCLCVFGFWVHLQSKPISVRPKSKKACIPSAAQS